MTLTRRQADTMDLLCEGLTTNEIAVRKGVSTQTVKNQLTLIYGKLGVTTRGGAMSVWLRPTKETEAALESAIGALEDAKDTVSRALFTVRKVG